MARDYTYDKAYRRAHRAEDAARHRARRLMIKKHGAAALKGKDVDHKNGNPKDNRMSNLRIVSKSVNRSKK
jgi:hypothetical protein